MLTEWLTELDRSDALNLSSEAAVGWLGVVSSAEERREAPKLSWKAADTEHEKG